MQASHQSSQLYSDDRKATQTFSCHQSSDNTRRGDDDADLASAEKRRLVARRMSLTVSSVLCGT